MNKYKFLLLVLFFPFFGCTQGASLTSVDSFAKTIKYKNNLTTLTEELTNPYSEELLKARAIFIWITENIDYDYKYYNKFYYLGKEPKTFACKDDKDCESKKIVWEIKYINNVLRKKRAVCQGYSMLFKKMCDIAGLKSEIIPGYARTEYYQVGTSGKLDHAWNAVWIDTAYYLLDATWAAGGCAKDDNGKLLSYIKSFNEYYWLTPPADFVRNHYPKNNNWVLLSNYTRDSFAANPYYDPGNIKNLKLILPASGIITAKKGDTIRFKISYTEYFRDLQINSNLFRNPDIFRKEKISRRKYVQKLDTFALSKQRYIDQSWEGIVYAFEYVVTDISLYYLDILFDRQRMLRFKVVIDRNIGNSN